MNFHDLPWPSMTCHLLTPRSSLLIALKLLSAHFLTPTNQMLIHHFKWLSMTFYTIIWLDLKKHKAGKYKFIFVFTRYTKRIITHLKFFKFCLHCKNSLTSLQDKVYNKYLGDRRNGASIDSESGARPTPGCSSENSGKEKLKYKARQLFQSHHAQWLN